MAAVIKNSPLFKCLFFLACLGLFSACEPLFQYHPYEIRLDEEQSDLNRKNIEKIQSKTYGDTLRFVLLGDPQLNYDELKTFSSHIKQVTGIDFILIAGDLSHFSIPREFIKVHELMESTGIPYIGVVGNHDLLGTGKEFFEKMFGPLDFSFMAGKRKFIGINTNSLEFNFNGLVPNISWLKQELEDTNNFEEAVIVSHIPPFSPDFDERLVQKFAASLAESNRVRLSLHGHLHEFLYSEPYNDNVRYVITDNIGDRGYVRITLTKDDFIVENLKY